MTVFIAATVAVEPLLESSLRTQRNNSKFSSGSYVNSTAMGCVKDRWQVLWKWLPVAA